MGLIKLVKENSGRIQTSLSTIIKLILILAILYATYFHLWHVLFADILLLILTFIPSIVSKRYEIYIPREFEILFLIFVLITFFLGDIKGWIIQLFFGTAIGFVGFAIMLILFAQSKMRKSYSLIILFSFSFSVALGLGAEMAKYYIKNLLNYAITVSDYQFAMSNLTFVAIGAIISSCISYAYMKGYRIKFMKDMVGRFKNKNPNLFIERTDSPEDLLKLIKKGESDKLEFKSTLRTNLHTKEVDKKIELSSLKNIIAFLNSEGGTLLIGVSDSGEILGIEKDNFPTNDKFNLHFTNLIKEKIGTEFLPNLHFELVMIEDKNILKVECEKSGKPVFLKDETGEEFYIRAGAASIELTGSKLLNYIRNNFKENGL